MNELNEVQRIELPADAFTPEGVARRIKACEEANADPNKDPNVAYSPYFYVTLPTTKQIQEMIGGK